jgi:hypothetical protein
MKNRLLKRSQIRCLCWLRRAFLIVPLSTVSPLARCRLIMITHDRDNNPHSLIHAANGEKGPARKKPLSLLTGPPTNKDHSSRGRLIFLQRNATRPLDCC